MLKVRGSKIIGEVYRLKIAQLKTFAAYSFVKGKNGYLFCCQQAKLHVVQRGIKAAVL